MRSGNLRSEVELGENSLLIFRIESETANGEVRRGEFRLGGTGEGMLYSVPESISESDSGFLAGFRFPYTYTGGESPCGILCALECS